MTGQDVPIAPSDSTLEFMIWVIQVVVVDSRNKGVCSGLRLVMAR